MIICGKLVRLSTFLIDDKPEKDVCEKIIDGFIINDTIISDFDEYNDKIIDNYILDSINK